MFCIRSGINPLCFYFTIFTTTSLFFRIASSIFFYLNFLNGSDSLTESRIKTTKKKQIQNKKRAIYVHANYVIRTYRLEIMHEIFEQKKMLSEFDH